MSQAALELLSRESGTRVLALSGDWTLGSLSSTVSNIERKLRELAADPELDWDLRNIAALDSAGALMIWNAWGKGLRERAQLRPEHASVLARFALAPPRAVERRAPLFTTPFVSLGRAEFKFFDSLVDLIRLGGFVVIDSFYVLARPSRAPWREISANMYKSGAQSLPVTALVGFLIGVVLAYLSALQLKAYGAEIYVINILGMSLIRELGPVLVAVLLAGRSGSAMTAQLGVMRVTEEIDAMATMGIPPNLRLVYPKILALSLATPLVVLWTCAAAMCGGAVVANVYLGLSFSFFFTTLPDVVPVANLWIALLKGVVFGVTIALVSCNFGLRVKANTESVSRGITSSVVISITSVIVIDAILAVLFKDVGFP
jgi:phospholipid/cholesterol/gamma-HCH transport system permease protein